MKIIKNLYFILTLLIIISCKRGAENNEVVLPNDGKLRIHINVIGVDDEQQVVLKQNSVSSIKEGALSKVIAQKKVTVEDNLEAYVSVTEEKIATSRNKSYLDTSVVSTSNTKSNKFAASRAMGANKTYVVVFQDKDGNFIEAVSANTNSTAVFTKGNYNTKYKWFAYSYNDNSSLTYNDANPNVNSSWNVPLLYSSGEITTSNSQPDNRLNIVFYRKSAIIEFVVDHRGLFDVPQALKIAPVGIGTTQSNHAASIKGGVFNLKTGEYSSITQSQTVTEENLTNFRSLYTGVDPIQSVAFHTVDTSQTISSLSMAFKEMRYMTDLGAAAPIPAETNALIRSAGVSATRDWQWATTNTATGFDSEDVVQTRNFTIDNFTPFNPKKGYRYRMVITLIYPKVSLQGVDADWAYGNLYYDSARPVGERYRIKHHNANYYGSTANDPDPNMYWRWRSLTPDGTANAGDPCLKVFPEGRWKMPSLANITSLRNVPNGNHATTSTLLRKYSQHDSGAPLNYFEFMYKGNSSTYWPFNWREALVVPQLGYRDNAGSIVSGSFSTVTNVVRNAYLWSEGGTLTNPSYLRLWSNTSNSFSNTQVISYVENGLAANNRMNIRCVRNPSFAYTPNLPAN